MKVNKEIRVFSRENVKKNGLFSIVIFFFAALVTSSFFFLNLLFDWTYLFVVPLVILPTLFSFQRAIILLREEDTLSFSVVFSGYRQYFSSRFSSTYSFFNTLLRLLIIFAITYLTSFTITFIVFLSTNYLGMKDVYNEINSMEYTLERINILIDDYQDLFKAFRFYSTFPPLFIISVSALFFFSRNSISYFMRISSVNYSGRYISSIHRLMIKNNSKAFYKAYFSLNYPLYILYILSFALGGYVGYLIHRDFNYILTFALAFSLFISLAIFGFKYFANKEALYYGFVEEYAEVDDMIKKARDDQLAEIKRKEEEYQKLMKELEDIDNSDNEQ